MPNFRLTKAAQQDLRSIGRYTQKTWGIEQRNRYLSMLDASFHRLAKTPGKGSSCDHIRRGYKKLPVGRHVIFYRVADQTVEIIRVLHDRMDVESQFDE